MLVELYCIQGNFSFFISKDLKVFSKYQQIEIAIFRRLELKLRIVTRKNYNDMELWRMRINLAINHGNTNEVTISMYNITIVFSS